jgi:cupin fold WbuC family metalloprotein
MSTNGLFKKSGEVLVCTDEIIGLEQAALNAVNSLADTSPKKRARICAHKDSSAAIQEMIIVIREGSYIAPHRHKNKCESFHIIDGSADIVVFEDNGDIRKVIRFAREHAFYYRLEAELFHTIIVRSDRITFHEVTNGPFIANATEFASFAPRESEDGIADYQVKLDKQIAEWAPKNA